MTLLYRTPNLQIEDLEFHATVETTRSGAAKRHFRWWKPGGMWAPLSAFKGHPPKGRILGAKFAPFQRHMLQAAAKRVLLRT
jgi:hypothetical protein